MKTRLSPRPRAPAPPPPSPPPRSWPARARRRRRPTTLHLVGTPQKGVGFMPKGAPRQGDRIGFGDTVTGDDTGHDRGVCTVIGRRGCCARSRSSCPRAR